METIIPTSNGYLTAHLWHVDSYIPLHFEHEYHAPLKGASNISLLRDVLINKDKQDGKKLDCGLSWFSVTKDADNNSILIYKGIYRENYNIPVTLTEQGRKQLIDLLEQAILQELD